MHAGSSPIPIYIGACMQAIWYVATAPTACLLYFVHCLQVRLQLFLLCGMYSSCIGWMQAVLYGCKLYCMDASWQSSSSSWCRLELRFITSASDMCCTYSLHQMGSLTWHLPYVMQQQELSSMVLKVLKIQINAITDEENLNHKVVLTAALFFMAMNPASTVAKSSNQQASMLCHGGYNAQHSNIA